MKDLFVILEGDHYAMAMGDPKQVRVKLLEGLSDEAANMLCRKVENISAANHTLDEAIENIKGQILELAKSVGIAPDLN